MKYCILFLLFSIHFFAGGQVEPSLDKAPGNNELKINALYLLFEFVELSYDRILNEESSVGISAAFDLSGEGEWKYVFLPYYRLYFGKKRAAGFFFELNAVVLGEEAREGTDTRGGLGVGFGGKFISRRDVVFELALGIGRLAESDELYGINVYPRVGVNVGKRF